MVKFIMITLQDQSNTHDGLSGIRYTIYKGKPFEVTDEQDIEYFRKNPRFQEVGIIEQIIKPKPIPEKDVDEKLREELSKLFGIKEKTINTVVKIYHSKENLTQTIEQGYKLDKSISKKQADIIKSFILGESKPNKKR